MPVPPEERRYADLHLHISLYTFLGRSTPEPLDSWHQDTFPKWVKNPPRGRYRKSQKPTAYTQADLTSLTQGQVRLAHATLYPLDPPLTGHVVIRWMNKNVVSGFRTSRMKELDELGPYASLKAEYAYLVGAEGTNPKTGAPTERFVLASNRSAYLQHMANPGQNRDTTVGVLNIEGGHALLDRPIQRAGAEADIEAWSANLRRLKENKDGWQHQVFYYTLSHFCDSGLVDHCRALPVPGIAWLFLGKAKVKIFEKLLLGSNGGTKERHEPGLGPHGKRMIRELLDPAIGGYSILPDVKHVSIRARGAYYAIAETLGIPIIASHMGFSGYPNEEAALSDPNLSSKQGARHRFYSFQLNLHDDEIRRIMKSGGLIGLNLDYRILGGKSRAYRRFLSWAEERYGKPKHLPITQHAMAGAILLGEHIRYAVEMAGPAAWACLCIGSDLGGLIDPIRAAPSWSQATTLRTYLREYFTEEHQQHWLKIHLPENLAAVPEDDHNALMLALDSALDAFFFGNVERFTKAYFGRSDMVTSHAVKAATA